MTSEKIAVVWQHVPKWFTPPIMEHAVIEDSEWEAHCCALQPLAHFRMASKNRGKLTSTLASSLDGFETMKWRDMQPKTAQRYQRGWHRALQRGLELSDHLVTETMDSWGIYNGWWTQAGALPFFIGMVGATGRALPPSPCPPHIMLTWPAPRRFSIRVSPPYCMPCHKTIIGG